MRSRGSAEGSSRRHSSGDQRLNPSSIIRFASTSSSGDILSPSAMEQWACFRIACGNAPQWEVQLRLKTLTTDSLQLTGIGGREPQRIYMGPSSEKELIQLEEWEKEVPEDPGEPVETKEQVYL
ncbi:hypothetical protein A6R68_17883, partial [Neotoma lepida]